MTFSKKNKSIEFKCLTVGDVFIGVNDPENVCIKIEEISNEDKIINAVDLRTGITIYLDPYDKVKLVEVELDRAIWSILNSDYID